MTGYRPTHPMHRLLYEMSGLGGRIGQSVRRKLMRRFSKRSVADFNSRVARLVPGDLCLDLGANMGVVTARLAATGAEVHAYEPDPYCVDVLTRRFAGYNNVHLHPQAVSGLAGKNLLRRTKDFDLAPDLESQGSSIAINAPRYYDDNNAVLVETLAFADVVAGFGRPVSLIKMDIEGAEFSILDHILAGHAAGRTPLPISALFVETHERHVPEWVAQLKDLRALNWDGKLPYPIDTFWP